MNNKYKHKYTKQTNKTNWTQIIFRYLETESYKKRINCIYIYILKIYTKYMYTTYIIDFCKSFFNSFDINP